MKKINVLIVLSSLFLVSSCTNTPKQTENKESTTAEKSHEEHDKAAETAKIQLDNGKKWAANVETTEGVQKMLALIEIHTASKSMDTKTLQGNLKKEFETIFEKCTMKGESHNQLHNYLLPLKEQLEHLEKQADATTIEGIKSYLSTYNTYFQ